MKNRSKRTLALVLLAAMVIGAFSGCKSGESVDEPSNSESGSEFVYLPSYVSMPEGVRDMSNTCLVGDTIYFITSLPFAPDGSIVPQEDIDAYYAQMDSFYASGGIRGGGVTIVNKETGEADGSDSDSDGDSGTGEEPPELEFTYETRLCSVNIDGTNLEFLPDFKAAVENEDVGSDSYVNGMIADEEGNLWVLDNHSEVKYDLPADFDPETDDQWNYYVGETNTYYVRKLSSTGEELSRINLNDIIPDAASREYFYLYNFNVDKAGNIYFDDGDRTLYVVDQSGATLAKLTVEGWINGFVSLASGDVLVALYGNDGKNEFRKVDLAAKDWGKTYKSSSYAYNFVSGDEEYDFYYNNGDALYGYKLEDEEATKVLSWLNNDVDGNYIQYYTIKENGDIFAVSYNYSSNSGGMEAINLVKTPASEAPVKEIITLATVGLDYSLRGIILNFNKTNPDYRIEVRDYSEYNTDDDYTLGVTKLNTEIISGKIPDIIDVSSLPYEQYAAKNLLEDLYPFIDNDSELSRDDLFESIFSALETEGKLHLIASSFYAISIVGKESVVGADPNWTMQQFQDLIKAHPEAEYPLGMGMTREQIFSQLFMLSMSNYVNWMTGECSFDSPEFKSLLEFAKTFPSDEDMDYENMQWVGTSELLANGQMIASFMYLSDFQSYQYYKAIYGGEIVFKGLPNEEGKGNAASLSGGIAMTTACKNKEVAWEIMRTLLTEEYQKENVWNFPTNKNVFDEKLEEAMKQEYDSEGNPISSGGMGDGIIEVDFYAITQEEADQIMELINSVNRIANYDTSLVSIIDEEAEAYFAGEKSVDEVAGLIQSRMKIYINEQR